MEANPAGSPSPDPASGPAGGFVEQLTVALDQRQKYLEQNVVARLKETFRIFHSSYKSIYNILHRKGLIQSDPYKNDKKISEVSAPSNSPFLDSERDAQMGIRLSDFDSQLDFLTSYFQFSVEYLDLRRLRDLAGLTGYIKWSALSTTSENMTSRVLADLMEKVKKGGDQMSISILNDSHEQLSRLQKQILQAIKEISEFQRERYKLLIRNDVMSRLPPESQKSDPESDEALRAVKKHFSRAGENRPFYPELAREVLLEDRAADAEKRRSDLLASLRVEENKPKQKKADNEFRKSLLDAIRGLAPAGRNLEECVDRLEENNRVLENRRLSFGERFRRWAMRALGHKDQKRLLEIKYVDITTKATHTEKLDFPDFCTSVHTKARLFMNTILRTSSLAKKLETAGDEQLLSFYGRNIQELRLIHRRLDSLDDYFKTAVTGDDARLLHGIKIELTNLKNDIIRANQKHHEFVSKREEIEQLKRLGVDVTE